MEPWNLPPLKTQLYSKSNISDITRLEARYTDIAEVWCLGIILYSIYFIKFKMHPWAFLKNKSVNCDEREIGKEGEEGVAREREREERRKKEREICL